MRRAITSRALLAVAGLATLALVGAPSEATHGCKLRGAKVLTRSKHAVVFKKSRRSSDPADTYGCLFRVGTIHGLGDQADASGEVVIQRAKLGGRYVAYELDRTGGVSEGEDRVRLLDLRTGRTKVDEPATRRAVSNGVESFVLKRNGSVAWIGRDSDPLGQSPSNFEVHAVADGEGTGNQTLDSGQNIDANSLALSGDRRRLLWTNRGKRTSAPLH